VNAYRSLVQLGVCVLLIVGGLYAIDYDQKGILVVYVLAGAAGASFLIEKLWK
jgi:hypothetical protein